MRRPALGRAGPDRAEAVAAVLVGRGPAPAKEIRIGFGVPRVRGMPVDALRVRLPDLDHEVVERRAVLLHHAARDLDRFAFRRPSLE